MKILLQKATLIDPKHAFHYSTKDLLITNGIITAIEDEIIDETAEIISYPNLHISRGWFDSSVCFGEPGYEERETLENGLKTAGLSGFTQIAVNPNTNPITDNQSTVCYLKNAGNKTATQIHPIASFSKNQEGKLLTELYDLKQNGAVAFGDYKKAIKNAELLKIALQYAQRFDGLLISHPTDTSIGSQGGVHEGNVSTRNGLSGTPTLSEILQIQRDLAVLEYSGGKLHIPFLSSAAAAAVAKDPSADDFVHYSQARAPTVRECARLQTFPDWYQSAGKRTTGGIRRAGNPRESIFEREVPKYTQIGNAVPVKLAYEIGSHFSKILKG